MLGHGKVKKVNGLKSPLLTQRLLRLPMLFLFGIHSRKLFKLLRRLAMSLESADY